MTPLEELQAAHKRLSELRTIATSAPWTIGAGSAYGVEVDGWKEGIIRTRVMNDADLIVTLHRTIDWQAAYLKEHVRRGRRTFKTWGRGWVYVDPDALELARAINRELS